METEQADRYTATRLSAELGIDNRKMREILTPINPVEIKGNRKFYILRDVLPQVAKHIGVPNVIDLNQERARKTAAEAELAEIELEQKRNSLVPVSDVIDAWLELIAACKSRMLSMPAKLAPVVAVEDNPAICKRIIEEQTLEALDELARWIEQNAFAADAGDPVEDSGSVSTAADTDSERVG
ncbi:MAG: hypothetical protein VW496_06200 [Pelagibacteraceae bacterium]